MRSVRVVVAGMAIAASAVLGGAGSANASGPWGGIYIGASAGWMGQDLNWAFNPAIPAAAHQAYSLDTSDGVYGLHVGIQHQFYSNFVIGAELGYSRSGDSWAGEPMFGNNPAFDSEARVEDIFQIGVRLGWSPSREWLLYVSGGYASADIHSRAISVATGAVAFSASERHDGWYVGGGVEFALTDSWILGLEYQHLDFGTERQCPGGACLGAAGFFVDRDMDASADVVRARLSFKFGRSEARYEPLK